MLGKGPTQISCDKKKKCDGMCPEGIITLATEVLNQGELIVYPTETLYGIGGKAHDLAIEEKILKAKKSPPDKKISVAYNDLEQAGEYLEMELPDHAWELEKHFLPGPLTIVIETDAATDGIRIPDHPIPQKIIEKFGPITSTSANTHGMQDPVSIESARFYLDAEVKLYIDCGPCEYGMGSTVVKVGEELEILREGAIEEKEIGEKIGL